jgi:hypothetical protein
MKDRIKQSIKIDWQNEEWRDIPEYEGYYKISNLGNIETYDRYVEWRGVLKKYSARVLLPSKDSWGYLQVVLCKNKIRKTFKVHKLVAMVFLNHNPNGMSIQIDHIDGDKLNNRLANLQIVSSHEHRVKTELQLGKKTSKYTGVSWQKRDKVWVVQIKELGKTKCIGRTKCEEEANRIYINYKNKILLNAN